MTARSLRLCSGRRDSDEGEDAEGGHCEDEGDRLAERGVKAAVLFEDRGGSAVDLGEAGLNIGEVVTQRTDLHR